MTVFATLHFLHNLRMGTTSNRVTSHKDRKGLPGTNTLAYRTHLQLTKNKALRIRPQDPNKLSENAKWNELLALRQSLQKLLPADHPEFELTASKRGATMDFNGIQVKNKQIKS
jgi:hypothetical protein